MPKSTRNTTPAISPTNLILLGLAATATVLGKNTNTKQDDGIALSVGEFSECITDVDGKQTCETRAPYTVSYPDGSNPVFKDAPDFQVPFEESLNVAMSQYNKISTNKLLLPQEYKLLIDSAYKIFNSAHKQSIKDKTGSKVFSDEQLLAFNDVANKLGKPINHGATNAKIRDLLNAQEKANGQEPTHTGRKMQK